MFLGGLRVNLIIEFVDIGLLVWRYLGAVRCFFYCGIVVAFLIRWGWFSMRFRVLFWLCFSIRMMV